VRRWDSATGEKGLIPVKNMMMFPVERTTRVRYRLKEVEQSIWRDGNPLDPSEIFSMRRVAQYKGSEAHGCQSSPHNGELKKVDHKHTVVRLGIGYPCRNKVFYLMPLCFFVQRA
jgi:hypothetical protein